MSLRDLRYGLRALLRNPGFTAVALLTIGIGIGANSTVFSWMRSMVLNPIPGAVQPQRIDPGTPRPTSRPSHSAALRVGD